MATTPLPWPEAPNPPLPPPTPQALDAIAAAAVPLSRWFYAPPDENALARLGEPGVLDSWPISADDMATRRGLELLARPHDHARIRADHTALFVGPGAMKAAPYESVHTSREGLLFEPETLDVRGWYRHYGLSAPRLGREPDDHVGLELEFVATLAGWAAEADDEGDRASASVFADGIRGFVTAHLLSWGPPFCDLVATQAGTDFYRGVAELTRGFLTALPVLMEPVP
ncbi:TorD/DmsD family molecular chaperone [Mobilicoccus massiliensis]|uniref:TorD/DmsD family molecular chaperone n=1 Tax=Mobilicoccus massiliensis TaxID=1522310 RepID=UPI001596C030|nr:molecular chaperone TorD family protein [Mobilicoccus massiliensis]